MPEFAPTVTNSKGSSKFSQRGGSRTSFWKPSRELVKQVLSATQTQFRTPIQYPGQTAVPTDPRLAAGIEGIAGRAMRGSPITGAAENLGAATLRGDFLDPASNPYLRDTFGMAARGVSDEYTSTILPGLESRFAGAGRTGGGSYQAALGRSQQGLGQSLGDLATQVYGGAYEAERGRQNQVLAMSPVLQSLGYMDSEALARSGSMAQAESQRLLNADVAKQRFTQMEPWQRAGLASGIAYGGSPVASGTEFWQEGTSSQTGKDVTISPYFMPEKPAWWESLLSGLGSMI